MRRTIQIGSNHIQVDKIVFWSYYQNDDGDNCVELQTSTGRYFYFVGSMHDKFIEEINKVDTKEYIVVTASYANDFERAVNKKLDNGYALYGSMQMFQSTNGFSFFQAMAR